MGPSARGGLALLLLACCALAAAGGAAAGIRAPAGGESTGTKAHRGFEAGTGTDAGGATDAPGAGAIDPVVAHVLEMLRGGVTEPVIVLWLDKSGLRPAAIGSGDVVALHQAGASDTLLKKLIELAGGAPATASAAPAATGPGTSAAAAHRTGPAPAAAAAAASAPSTPAHDTAPTPATAALTPTAAAPAPGASATATSPPGVSASATSAPLGTPAAASPPASTPAAEPTSGVKVHFAVTYRPAYVEDEEPWSLVLYADGRFLGSVKPAPPLLPLPPQTFEVALAPGKHLLRLAQERHLRYSSHRGYITPSRVDPSEFPIELHSAAATQIEIHWGQRNLWHPGPIRLRLVQDGAEVARLEPRGNDSYTWPALCEDIPSGLPPGAQLPRTARRDAERCVRWTDLWAGIPALPSRDEVRAEIERQLASAAASK